MSCLITTKVIDGQLWLVGEIIDRNMYLYCVRLSRLAPLEHALDAGAFTRFSHLPLRHDVTYELMQGHNVDHNVMRGMLSWVDQRVQDEWNVDLDMRHINWGFIRWSFANPQDAMLFKLTWPNPTCAPVEFDAV